MRHRLMGLVLGLLVATGGSACSFLFSVSECETDGDCDVGNVCVENRCVPSGDDDDAGPTDAGNQSPDAGAADAGAADAGAADAGAADAGAADAGLPSDGGGLVADAASPDASSLDGGTPDVDAVDGGPAWAPPFAVRRPIVLDGVAIDDDLTDFPVWVSLDANPLTAGAVGNEVTFYDDNDQLLGKEIVSYDPATGACTAFVRLPFLAADTGHTFYAYFSPLVGVPVSPSAWTAEYRGVWHLDTGESGEAFFDSSPAGHDGVAEDTGVHENQPQLPGVLGDATNFDGTGGIAVAWGDADPMTSLTVSAWVSPENATADLWMRVLSKRQSFDSLLGFDAIYNPNSAQGSNQPDTHIRVGTDTFLGFVGDSGSGHAPWVHLFFMVQSGGFGRAWVDGVERDAELGVPLVDDITQDLLIGRPAFDNVAENFRGLIDEIRIARTVRPLGWVRTTYENQKPGSTFASVLAAETRD